MKKQIIVVVVAAAAALFLTVLPVLAEAKYEAVPYESYVRDNISITRSPESYTPMKVIDGHTLGVGSLNQPMDMCFGPDGSLYVLDSGNSRVLILDEEYAYRSVLGPFIVNGEAANLTGASGLFVTQEGNCLIADTENARVLEVNNIGTVTQVLTLPESELIPDDFLFQPMGVIKDQKGFTYVLSRGSYYGAIIYNTDNTFFGFYGANLVSGNVLQSLQKFFMNLFVNKEVLSTRVQALPYQFTGFCLGPEDFLYSLTSSTKNGKGQVRKLSPGGNNTLTFQQENRYLNADYMDFTDRLKYTSLNGTVRRTNFSDLDVDDDAFMYLLDATYGKVFVYDRQCNLLSIFGGGLGKGEQTGTFVLPVAISVKGNDLLVLDQTRQCITLFQTTDYGQTLKAASLLDAEGNTAAARPLWEQILQKDRYCTLAYSGIARDLYVQKEYKSAMEYAENGGDKVVYAKAFQMMRNEYLTDNFVWIFPAVLLALGSIVLLLVYSSRKNSVLVRSASLRLVLRTTVHPIDTFQKIRWHGQGSLLISIVCLTLFYVLQIINTMYSGFIYNTYSPYNDNSVYILLGTAGLILLWVIANWAVCTLMEGKGNLKQIFIASCYALLPELIGLGLSFLFSHILMPEEHAIAGVVSLICHVWFILLLLLGVTIIHDFSFFKAIRCALISMLAMILIVFIIFMVLILFKDFYDFAATVVSEWIFRMNN